MKLIHCIDVVLIIEHFYINLKSIAEILPFCVSVVKLTFCPSLSSLIPACSTAEICKNMSFDLSFGSIKP